MISITPMIARLMTINPKYNRLENESDFEWGLRLINEKVEKHPEDLEWLDIVECLGLDIHPDSLRKVGNTTQFSAYNVSKYYREKLAEPKSIKAKDSYFSELELKQLEIKKEKQKFFDQRNAFNKEVRDRSRKEEVNEIITDAIAKLDYPLQDYQPEPIVDSDNDILVSLNDPHYGADVDNYWNFYNSDVLKRMIQDYLDEIIVIAARHHSENCIVWANGDLISGNIHKSIEVANKENTIQQIFGVSELFAEFLHELSKHFKTVRFYSVSGNHSRLEPKKLASKDERLDDIVEWYLRARLQNNKTILFDDEARIDESMYIFNIRGKNYLGVHGDYDNSPAGVTQLVQMVERPVYAILSAHFHHNRTDEVQGIKTVMAGSFMGMDDNCVTKRIKGVPEQMINIATKDGIYASYGIEF